MKDGFARGPEGEMEMLMRACDCRCVDGGVGGPACEEFGGRDYGETLSFDGEGL